MTKTIQQRVEEKNTNGRSLKDYVKKNLVEPAGSPPLLNLLREPCQTYKEKIKEETIPSPKAKQAVAINVNNVNINCCTVS